MRGILIDPKAGTVEEAYFGETEEEMREVLDPGKLLSACFVGGSSITFCPPEEDFGKKPAFILKNYLMLIDSKALLTNHVEGVIENSTHKADEVRKNVRFLTKEEVVVYLCRDLGNA